MRHVVERYRGLGLATRLLLGGGLFVVVVGIGLLVVLLVGRPSVSVSSGRALVKVKLSGIGTELRGVRATSDGRPISLVEGAGGLVPAHQLTQDETVKVTAVATAPSWLRWLLGGSVSTTKTLRTPEASPAESVALSTRHGRVPVSFDNKVSVVEYRSVGGEIETLHLSRASTVARLSVSPELFAGTVEVAASPEPWEKVASEALSVKWFVVPPDKETLVLADPGPGATSARSDGRITLTFDKPVAKLLGSSRPILKPSVPGSWSERGPNTLVFTPKGFGFGPGTVVTVSFPEPVTITSASGIPGTSRTASAAKGSLASANTVTDATSFHFTTGPGSVLRLEEILAQLHYLPLNFVPASGAKVPRTFAEEVATMSRPLPGTFSWRWASTPASLEAEWAEGEANTMLKGALMAFEAAESSYDGYQADEETVNQLADASLWRELLEADLKDSLDPSPYAYVYVSQNLPETLTIWENGRIVLTSPCNTGIPESPTANGTFPIYVRFTFNYMSGFNPDGSYYDDPVYWINYFNGGDAVHGFIRASYGFPQSLGCVELPIPTAQVAFGYLAIGDLVTVAP